MTPGARAWVARCGGDDGGAPDLRRVVIRLGGKLVCCLAVCSRGFFSRDGASAAGAWWVFAVGLGRRTWCRWFTAGGNQSAMPAACIGDRPRLCAFCRTGGNALSPPTVSLNLAFAGGARCVDRGQRRLGAARALRACHTK